MARVTNAVASHRRKKRMLKRAKGFVGDRKNHLRLTKEAVMRSWAFNYVHRKQKKQQFRRLWIVRIATAAKMHGLSYSRLIDGLKKAEHLTDRKMLADLAIKEPKIFETVVLKAKQALQV